MSKLDIEAIQTYLGRIFFLVYIGYGNRNFESKIVNWQWMTVENLFYTPQPKYFWSQKKLIDPQRMCQGGGPHKRKFTLKYPLKRKFTPNINKGLIDD